MHMEESVPDLVRRALAQPLIVREGGAVEYAVALNEWAETLAARWPLWALRAEAYTRLNDSPALTYPLSRFVESICRDEGLDGSPSAPAMLEELDALVDRRRIALVTGERFSWDTAVLSEEEGVHSTWSFGSAAFPRILNGPVLASYQEDTPYSIGGYNSPYEEIGIELVELLDQRRAAAPGSPEQIAAKRRLSEFLIRVGGSFQGHPTRLRSTAARQLAQQGFPLFRALWVALATKIEINAKARRVLETLGGASAEREEWALRLVLPNLSAAEIKAMRQKIRVSGPLSGVHPAEAFCLHVITHRLAIPVEKVARKMKHGWAAEMIAVSGGCAVCEAPDHRSAERGMDQREL